MKKITTKKLRDVVELEIDFLIHEHLSASASAQKRARNLIADEAANVILEEITNDECSRARLDDMEQVKQLIMGVCEVLSDAVDKITKNIPKPYDGGVQNDSPEQRVVPDQVQPAETGASQTHKVVRGDTFWGLARKYLGNPRRWEEIMNANMDLLGNRPKRVFKSRGNQKPPAIPVIRPGDELTIPPE